MNSHWFGISSKPRVIMASYWIFNFVTMTNFEAVLDFSKGIASSTKICLMLHLFVHILRLARNYYNAMFTLVPKLKAQSIDTISYLYMIQIILLYCWQRKLLYNIYLVSKFMIHSLLIQYLYLCMIQTIPYKMWLLTIVNNKQPS